MVELTLVDTSAWIEWLRDTGSVAAAMVGELRADPRVVAVTQPVALEVRAGTRRANLRAVNRVLDDAVQLSVEPNEDFDVAAELYARTRDIGKPVRSLRDCVIAAVAIRSGAVLLHCDRDFDTLAAVAPDLRAQSGLSE
ncbi:MAG: PIN domain-containing protein [Actinophytocola sp.]|nr:PIN domain-containing protein [Actinophytocola sp.]